MKTCYRFLLVSLCLIVFSGHAFAMLQDEEISTVFVPMQETNWLDSFCKQRVCALFQGFERIKQTPELENILKDILLNSIDEFSRARCERSVGFNVLDPKFFFITQEHIITKFIRKFVDFVAVNLITLKCDRILLFEQDPNAQEVKYDSYADLLVRNLFHDKEEWDLVESECMYFAQDVLEYLNSN